MDYANISRALAYYQERGYVYVDDAPWQVGITAYYATKPVGAKDVKMLIGGSRPSEEQFVGFPVASGEQSFIQMMLDGQPVKRAISVTPCHRAEPRLDTLHRPYFMKAELINAQDVDEGHLVHMIHDACGFFESVGLSVRVVKTNACDFAEPAFDIVEKGTRFELGSYGIRRRAIGDKDLDWIYGTACAEPRLSTAIMKCSRHTGR